MLKIHPYYKLILLIAIPTLFHSCTKTGNIDREALVTRHNPVINRIDSLDVLTAGNGNFAFTVDATGLQTFPDSYEKGIPLGTMSNWGWHSFPNTNDYQLEEVNKNFSSCEDSIPYVYRWFEGEKKEPSEFLRQNPHRLHLGLVGYSITKSDGSEIELEDVKDVQLKLNMWSGEITSQFSVEGIPVKTSVFVHQQNDQISVSSESELIEQGRLKIRLRYPYGSGCHTCAGYDFSKPDKHSTQLVLNQERKVIFERKLDSTLFYIVTQWEQPGKLQNVTNHEYLIVPDAENHEFRFTVLFNTSRDHDSNTYNTTAENNRESWRRFWQSGGAIDFSGSTDPRALEIERRVVLSQYLTKIQGSGNLPPQETGLTFNSWYGKFHLEMHWWHAVHFMLWNRPELFAESLGWYNDILPQAKAMAGKQGFSGARWPKMIAPDGIEGPSNVGPFLVWQQPHPIYYAELFYRNNPTDSVLQAFKEIVFETAQFMASFPYYNKGLDQYDLCSPLLPAQEIFNYETTYNPAFELAYWHYGLQIAQQWRERLGLEPDTVWQTVLDKLAPLPVADNLYLPHQNQPDAYSDKKYRADHPIVLGALGFLPATLKIDSEIMLNTFDEVMNDWNWGHTWGWDYPLIAMTAARLNKPEKAIDALFMDLQKNRYLKNGHNYQNSSLSIYLPGNGGLLTAVAMMAAGWDGATEKHCPGFPDNGKWKIKYENLSKMP